MKSNVDEFVNRVRRRRIRGAEDRRMNKKAKRYRMGYEEGWWHGFAAGIGVVAVIVFVLWYFAY